MVGCQSDRYNSIISSGFDSTSLRRKIAQHWVTKSRMSVWFISIQVKDIFTMEKKIVNTYFLVGIGLLT